MFVRAHLASSDMSEISDFDGNVSQHIVTPLMAQVYSSALP